MGRGLLLSEGPPLPFRLFVGLLLQARDPFGDIEVGDGDKDEKQEIHPAALIEEIVGEERQKEDARSERLAERHIDERKGEEEEEEEPRGEEQRLARIVREHCAQPFPLERDKILGDFLRQVGDRSHDVVCYHCERQSESGESVLLIL